MARRSSALLLFLATILVSATAIAAGRPTGVTRWCSGQSSAGFPHAFTSRDNLVVGPLVMVGAGRFTDAGTVRQFGGNKFPLLVAAGHRVTIELTRRARRTVALGYGPWSHQGEQTVRDGQRVTTFRACNSRRSGSRADGRRVTFWSGFVMASEPRCVHLRVWVDDEPAPRRARIALGQRCR